MRRATIEVQQATTLMLRSFAGDSLRSEPPPEVLDALQQHFSTNKERVTRIFRRWDVNADGVIDRAELQIVLHDIGIPFSAVTLVKFFADVDANGDGELDLKELNKALGGAGLRRSQSVKAVPALPLRAGASQAKSKLARHVEKPAGDEDEDGDDGGEDDYRVHACDHRPPSGPYVFRIPARTAMASSGYYARKQQISSSRTI